jgi:hypothetical protein
MAGLGTFQKIAGTVGIFAASKLMIAVDGVMGIGDILLLKVVSVGGGS